MNQAIDSHQTKRSALQKGLILGVVSLLAIMLAIGSSCADDTKAVPDVTGMTKADAERMLKDNGFAIGNETDQESASVESGKVISQSPGAAERQKPGTAINLAVSTGKTTQVHVPNLKGMTQTQAEDALMAVDLIPRPEDPVYVSDVTPGKVFSQSIPADNVVDSGTSVGFTVALGNETAEIPNVVGMSREDAFQALVNASFNVDVLEAYNDNVSEGLIMDQNPNPKIQAVKGTTVTLTVSMGAVPAEKVEVPNLMTYTLSQAQLSLSSAGLLLNASGDLTGTVVSQGPAGGTQVDKGTTVNVSFGYLYPQNDANEGDQSQGDGGGGTDGAQS